MTTIELPDAVALAITDIKPYWNNPRRIPPEAVAAVRESIERYGYQQPIVVDTDNVIVVGHTRFEAVKQLGWTTVPVYVTDLPPDKANEYRLVDNRTSEMSQWDHAALVVELREFEQSLLDSFFPDIDIEIGLIEDAITTNEDVAAASKTIREVPALNVDTVEVICPSCFHSFSVRSDALVPK